MSEVKLNLSGHANESLDNLGFVFPGAMHVNLADPDLPEKLAEFLSPYMGSGDIVTVAMPGLAPLAILTVTVIHGITGQFPNLQPLVRAENGQFVPGPTLDLQSIRNDTARRRCRDGAVCI